MVTKSHRNRSVISPGSLIIAGAVIALAILLQSPHLAFADDLPESTADAEQADVPTVTPAPAPPTADVVPAPVAPIEGVTGPGTAIGSTPVVPPASSVATSGYYFGSWRKSGSRWWFSYPAAASRRDGGKSAMRGISLMRRGG